MPHSKVRLSSIVVAGMVFLAASLPGAAPVAAAATATASGSATMTIVQIRDALGNPIPAPMGLTINPFTIGPNQGPDAAETGTGAVAYSGTATISGMAETTQVAITSGVAASASPAGTAEGTELVSGDIQFLNNSGQTLTIDVRFDWAVSASATVTDAALEAAQVVIADVEIQETVGGSPTSPCTGGLFVDAELNLVAAPPDAASSMGPGTSTRTVVLPDEETCSFAALAQIVAEARAEPMAMPSLPGAMAVLLLLALLGAGWWRLTRRTA